MSSDDFDLDDPRKDDAPTPESMAAAWAGMPDTVEDDGEPDGGIDRLMTQEEIDALLTAGPDAEPDARRFSLPDGYAAVLTEPESLTGMAPLAQSFAGVAAPFPHLLAAFRTGA